MFFPVIWKWVSNFERKRCLLSFSSFTPSYLRQARGSYCHPLNTHSVCVLFVGLPLSFYKCSCRSLALGARRLYGIFAFWFWKVLFVHIEFSLSFLLIYIVRHTKVYYLHAMVAVHNCASHFPFGPRLLRRIIYPLFIFLLLCRNV